MYAVHRIETFKITSICQNERRKIERGREKERVEKIKSTKQESQDDLNDKQMTTSREKRKEEFASKYKNNNTKQFSRNKTENNNINIEFSEWNELTSHFHSIIISDE